MHNFTLNLLNKQDELDLANKYNFNMLPDLQRGNNWFFYYKKDWHTWTCSRGWVVAKRIGFAYYDHEYFDSLEKAFKAINKKLGIKE